MIHTGYTHYAARSTLLEILAGVEDFIADELACLDKRL
jgi:hypothetical protein